MGCVRFPFILVAAMLLWVGLAQATPPCGPYVAAADEAIFTGIVTAIDENVHPYENCSLQDQSQCVMRDESALTVAVKNWQSGPGKSDNVIIKPALCASIAPPHEAGGFYRFTVSPNGHDFQYHAYEKLADSR